MAEARERADEPQDLAGIVSRYRRHVPLILALTVLMIVLAAVATYFIPKRYTATAELTYQPQPTTNAVTGLKDPPMTDPERDAQVDAQVQLVGSLPVARLVVKAMNLQNDPDIQQGAQAFSTTGGDPLDAFAAAALNNLKVRRVGQTSLFDINYTHPDALKSAEIANAFAAAYQKIQVQQKLDAAQSGGKQANGQIQSLRKEVEDADAAVARYRAEHNLVTDPDSPSDGQELTSVSASLADARASQAESNARFASVAKSGGIAGSASDPNDPLASPVMSDLRRQQAEVSRKVAQLAAHYGPRYPDVVEAQSELDALNNQIQQEQDRIVKTAQAQANVANERTSSLVASRAATMGRLSGNVAANVMLSDLQSRATTARQLYESMLARSGQATADQGTMLPDSAVSTPASPPLKPSFPSMPIDIVLGAVLGIGLGIAIAFLRERWSVGINTIDDVDRLLDQNYLNTIPTLASAIDAPKTENPIDAIVQHPLSLFTEAYRSLGASLIYADRAKPAKVIGLTSALPKEGKSTTSAALARVLAMAGSKVLLMDCDLRRRSVTMEMTPTAELGLMEVLAGTCTLDQAVLQDQTGAMILPLAPRSHLGGQPFDTPGFDTLMATLRNKYDVIVMDTAPALAVVDTRLLLRHIDSLGLLARWRSTPVKAIRAALHQIESVGGQVTGVALTFVNLKTQAQSGYGDASYYYREMKDYYMAAE